VRPITKIGIWSGGIVIGLLVIAFTASFFIDEPLRRRTEEKINGALQGYRVNLPHLDFNPIGFSITLENLKLIQKEHPDPPLGQIARLQASVHWRALLRGRLVADFNLERPEIHLELTQLRQEANRKVSLEERGWKHAVQAAYPLKINVINVSNGRFTYIDEDPQRPLILSEISLQAENIRNVHSPESVYPSPFDFSARVFDKGRLDIGGNANFLADPHPGLEAQLDVQGIELESFRPVLARYHLFVSGGLFAAQGRLEYAPETKTAQLTNAQIDSLKLDYIHTPQTAATRKAKVEKTRKVGNQPGLLLRIDDFHLTGEVGFVNKARDPSYRLFLQQTELRLTNLSNQFKEGPAEARLTGNFMGSGKTQVLARFRSEQEGPDFDLHVRILGTQMKALNDLLRAYGDFDVTAGRFSLFTEMHVQNQEVQGYVKPFFKDLNVYDPSQDEEKNLFQKLYEGLIDDIAELLKNEATEVVATKADISGQIENPDANTGQVIANLIQNAFFDVIMPGFDETVQSK
jgi:hypothetical protein